MSQHVGVFIDVENWGNVGIAEPAPVIKQIMDSLTALLAANHIAPRPEFRLAFLEMRYGRDATWHHRCEAEITSYGFRLVWAPPGTPAEQCMMDHVRAVIDDHRRSHGIAEPIEVLIFSSDTDIATGIDQVRFIGTSWHHWPNTTIGVIGQRHKAMRGGQILALVADGFIALDQEMRPQRRLS